MNGEDVVEELNDTVSVLDCLCEYESLYDGLGGGHIERYKEGEVEKTFAREWMLEETGEIFDIGMVDRVASIYELFSDETECFCNVGCTRTRSSPSKCTPGRTPYWIPVETATMQEFSMLRWRSNPARPLDGIHQLKPTEQVFGMPPTASTC